MVRVDDYLGSPDLALLVSVHNAVGVLGLDGGDLVRVHLPWDLLLLDIDLLLICLVLRAVSLRKATLYGRRGGILHGCGVLILLVFRLVLT